MTIELRLLIIGFVWPEPNSSAAGRRMMQLIQLFLAQDWQITFVSAAAESEHQVDLRALGVETAVIQLNDSSFDDFVAELNPDIVLFDRFMIEEQFGWRVEATCPDALRLLNTEDLHFLRKARQEVVQQKRPLQQKDWFSDAVLREVASILRSDLTILISEFEQAFLQENFSINPQILHVTPFLLNKIDEETVEGWLTFAERQHFVTIGNFRHPPNWDAVLQLKQTIWPKIRQQLPETELHVYGAYPSRKVMDLHQPAQGFHVLGWAEDAQAIMQKARVCLAPLRFGAGLKGKLVEAMLCGTPSVTTTVGAEGINGDLAWNGGIVGAWDDFVETAVSLYQDEQWWQTSQANGVAIINQRFDKTVHGPKLIQRIETVRQNLEEHRLQNFTGAMLRHHTMKSTMYMSRWIEAKNRR